MFRLLFSMCLNAPNIPTVSSCTVWWRMIQHLAKVLFQIRLWWKNMNIIKREHFFAYTLSYIFFMVYHDTEEKVFYTRDEWVQHYTCLFNKSRYVYPNSEVGAALRDVLFREKMDSSLIASVCSSWRDRHTTCFSHEIQKNHTHRFLESYFAKGKRSNDKTEEPATTENIRSRI